MKTDLPPAPARPPAKRRTLHDRNATPNIWLHQWSEDDTLPPGARIRAADELVRRRLEDRRIVVEAGILVGTEGATPLQVSAFSEWWDEAKVTKLIVPGCFPSPLGTQRNRPRVPTLREVVADVQRRTVYCRSTDAEELREVVLHASTLVALPPRVSVKTGDVWDAVKYAKHRKVLVTVILPDGTIQTGGVA